MAKRRRYIRTRKENTQQFTLRIPAEMDEAVEKIARKEGMSMNTTFIRLMTAGLERYASHGT
jgi:predicted HicB family RNase H-like nuclease